MRGESENERGINATVLGSTCSENKGSGNNLAELGWIKDLRVGDLFDPILLLVDRH